MEGGGRTGDPASDQATNNAARDQTGRSDNKKKKKKMTNEKKKNSIISQKRLNFLDKSHFLEENQMSLRNSIFYEKVCVLEMNGDQFFLVGSINR